MADIATQRRRQVTGARRANPEATLLNTQPVASTKNPSTVILIFIISLALPISFFLGSVRLSPYRLVLLLAIVPCFVSLLSSSATRVRGPDVFIGLFAVWGALALFVNSPSGTAIEPAAVFVVESAGAYLLGRILITDARAFSKLVRYLFLTLLVLLPFAIAESLTDKPVILELLRPFVSVPANLDIGPRLGLHRAQVVFEHPILFGTFAASLFGMTYYIIFRQSTAPARIAGSSSVVAASILSMSSGALAVLMAQFVLVGWDHMTRSLKNRWLILILLFAAFFLAVDILSNRTPFHVIVTYLTFSTGSAYNRILIFQYGIAEVWRNPLLGIGLGDWIRPSWMSGSMDNFWLAIAVRYGVPAFVFLALAFFCFFRSVGKLKLPIGSHASYRAGLFVSLGGIIIGGCTVHIWNASYCLVLFLLGSGMWMLDANAENPSLARRERTGLRSRVKQVKCSAESGTHAR